MHLEIVHAISNYSPNSCRRNLRFLTRFGASVRSYSSFGYSKTVGGVKEPFYTVGATGEGATSTTSLGAYVFSRAFFLRSARVSSVRTGSLTLYKMGSFGYYSCFLGGSAGTAGAALSGAGGLSGATNMMLGLS